MTVSWLESGYMATYSLRREVRMEVRREVRREVREVSKCYIVLCQISTI